MTLFRMNGVGLPNVFLLNGFTVQGEGAESSVSYQNLDGLYMAIGRAIVLSGGLMTGAELRFLRKRLGMSQEQVGELGGKSAQVAAKWEKGQVPVPLAESRWLRVSWVEKFAPAMLLKWLPRIRSAGDEQPEPNYVFACKGDTWISTQHREGVRISAQSSTMARQVIHRAMTTSVSAAGASLAMGQGVAYTIQTALSEQRHART